MSQEIIDEIANDVKEFVAKNNNTKSKINNIEEKISMIENYFNNSTPALLGENEDLEHKNALNDFVRKGKISDLITKSISGANDDGGVTLTPTLSKKIITALKEKSPMRKLASVEKISTRSYEVIIEDGKFNSGWVQETDERKSTDNPNLKKKIIHTHEIYAQPKATQTIINDSEVDIENWIVSSVADSFLKLENDAFINGDGKGKPFGLLQNKDVKIIEQDDLSTNGLLELSYSLEEGYCNNSCFLMNRNTLAKIQSLQDANGRFIWQQSISDSFAQTIFGIPVFVSSNMPEIGKNNKSIAFGDFASTYKIIDRQNIDIMRDPYTDKPFVKFYTTKRVGGDVVNPKAMRFLTIKK